MVSTDLKMGVKKLFSAYARVAYVMLIVFGSEVISRYSDEKCDTEFLSGNFVVRDNINYLLFASLFSYACGTMVFTTDSENSTTQDKILSGLYSRVHNSILTQFAVVTSHCEAIDPKIDGDVDGLLPYAIILFTLMVAHSISNTTFVNLTGEGDSNARIQKWFHLSNWIIRLLFVSFLLNLLMHDRFDNESLNGKQQKKASCIGAMDSNHEEFEWYKTISLADFNTSKIGGKSVEVPHEKNENMYIVIWTVLGVLILEGVLKMLSYLQIFDMESSSVGIIIGDIYGLFVDISLAIVLMSLTLANDIAACPMFDPYESRVRTVYIFAVVYIGFQFFMDMARFMNIDIVLLNKSQITCTKIQHVLIKPNL